MQFADRWVEALSYHGSASSPPENLMFVYLCVDRSSSTSVPILTSLHIVAPLCHRKSSLRSHLFWHCEHTRTCLTASPRAIPSGHSWRRDQEFEHTFPFIVWFCNLNQNVENRLYSLATCLAVLMHRDSINEAGQHYFLRRFVDHDL